MGTHTAYTATEQSANESEDMHGKDYRIGVAKIHLQIEKEAIRKKWSFCQVSFDWKNRWEKGVFQDA